MDLPFDLAALEPGPHFRNHFAGPVGIVEHQEALDIEPVGDDAGEIGRRRHLRRIVGGDQAADSHPAMGLQSVVDGDHDVTADVFEIEVDPVGCQPVQRLSDILILVVNGRVEAEFFGQPAAFPGPARNADDATAARLCHLTGDRTHRAGGCGDHKRLAGLGLEHICHAEIGRHSGHAEHAEIRGQRHAGRAVHLPELHLIDHGIVRPATGHRGHHIAGPEPAGTAFLDHTEGQASHDPADRYRRQITLGIVHPGAVGGVQRQIDRADQNLGFFQGRNRSLDQFEVSGPDQALGPLAQHPLTIHASHGHLRVFLGFSL